jgi:hypothetical protein
MVSVSERHGSSSRMERSIRGHKHSSMSLRSMQDSTYYTSILALDPSTHSLPSCHIGGNKPPLANRRSGGAGSDVHGPAAPHWRPISKRTCNSRSNAGPRPGAQTMYPHTMQPPQSWGRTEAMKLISAHTHLNFCRSRAWDGDKSLIKSGAPPGGLVFLGRTG